MTSHRRIRIGLSSACALAAIAVAVSPAGGAGPNQPKPAATSCHLPHATGETTVPLTVAGRERPFLIFVPADYDGRSRLPLVLNLHPSGGNGALQMEISQMAAMADEGGFAVAAPNGAVEQGSDSYLWNVPGVPLISGAPVPPGTPSDEDYLLAVIRRVGDTICTDTDRVYVTGFSGGARMTSQMACDFSTKIAAIAPVAGLRSGFPERAASGAWTPAKSSCRPKQAVPVRTFHGLADTTNPYSGNDDPRWGYGVEEALARWARLDRCKRGPNTTTATPTVSLLLYSKCRDGATVGLYREQLAGHTWPGSAGPPDGTTDESIDATALIWKFFRRHSLAERD